MHSVVWSDWVDAQADLIICVCTGWSLLVAQVILFILSCSGYNLQTVSNHNNLFILSSLIFWFFFQNNNRCMTAHRLGHSVKLLKFLTPQNEPPHDKTNEMACAPSEDSDQPGHPSSLIRVFAVRSIGSEGPKLSSCGQQRLIRLGGCLSWSESLLGAHAILLILSCHGSNIAVIILIFE